MPDVDMLCASQAIGIAMFWAYDDTSQPLTLTGSSEIP